MNVLAVIAIFVMIGGGVNAISETETQNSNSKMKPEIETQIQN
jgi:hypothetical protein